MFSKSVDKKSVWPYEFWTLAKKYKKEYQIWQTKILLACWNAGLASSVTTGTSISF